VSGFGSAAHNLRKCLQRGVNRHVHHDLRTTMADEKILVWRARNCRARQSASRFYARWHPIFSNRQAERTSFDPGRSSSAGILLRYRRSAMGTVTSKRNRWLAALPIHAMTSTPYLAVLKA
jgi:hypothetical protein